MGSINVLSETLVVSEACDENSQNVGTVRTKNWNCVISEAFLTCYFDHIKEEEENRDGTIRSRPAEAKKLKCSLEEYQQLVPILRKNTSYKQLCKCFNCQKIYKDQNVHFLFGFKNIECLPTEMLLIIFKHLTSSDRRVASECCKRFLEIWLCDDFADDRFLVFNRCVLDPEREPLSTFLKSPRNYCTLMFGDVIMRGESILSEKFGEIITTIDLMCCYLEITDEDVNKYLSLLPQLQNLKTLKVANDNLLGDFSNVPTSIKLLSISDYGTGTYEGDKLNMLKCFLDKTSDSFRVELHKFIKIRDIVNFTDSQRNKIQTVEIDVDVSDKRFKLPHFGNLKYLELYLFGNSDYYGTKDILDNLDEQLPALKDLYIHIDKRLPHKNWTFLKSLTALNILEEELSQLSIFINLEELYLEPSYENCYFGHETFVNKNLKELTIDYHDYFPKDACFTCFQTMTKSFPNLENLTCYFEVTNDHLEELATNTPKLKCLTLVKVDPSVSFACLPNLTELCVFNLTKSMIETWPLMLQLRKLNAGLSSLKFEMVKIFEQMPALQELFIDGDFINDDQFALVEALIKPLKRLKTFFFECGRIEPEIYFEIIDMLARNCKYLKEIKLYCAPSKEILEQLLQKHSSIRCIDGVWLK